MTDSESSSSCLYIYFLKKKEAERDSVSSLPSFKIDDAFTKLAKKELKDWKILQQSETELQLVSQTQPQKLVRVVKDGEKFLRLQPIGKSHENLGSLLKSISNAFSDYPFNIKYALECPLKSSNEDRHVANVIQLTEPYFLWCKQHKELEYGQFPSSLFCWFPEVSNL